MDVNVSERRLTDVAQAATRVRELPARLQLLIAAQEAESEKLIGWVQLAVLGI